MQFAVLPLLITIQWLNLICMAVSFPARLLCTSGVYTRLYSSLTMNGVAIVLFDFQFYIFGLEFNFCFLLVILFIQVHVLCLFGFSGAFSVVASRRCLGAAL